MSFEKAYLLVDYCCVYVNKERFGELIIVNCDNPKHIRVLQSLTVHKNVLSTV